ncbi:HD domain-containing protein [candidate division KSB1 bacterium]|nr:HD domain-containing protein [candidate division KSB1 bacterium]
MNQDILDLLVIDDEQEIIGVVESALRDFHLTIGTACSVRAARELVREQQFRVVLTDQRLPDGLGLDFIEDMAARGMTSVPILMTGLVDVDLALAAINRGKVFKLVTKPLDVLALRETVNRAIAQHSQADERKRLATEVLRFNEHLRKESALKDRTLREAADRIRSGEQTLQRQQQRIVSLYTELQQAYLRTVMSLTAAIDAKDTYTRGHSERVYRYCRLMAEVLGFDAESQRDLKLASVLHDLGKIGIPDAILLKKGPLTMEERAVMATHPAMTESILQPLPFLEKVRRIVREHHERYDGTGYPLGLSGSEISIEARVLTVADAFDAMRSDRPYRAAMSDEEALAELLGGCGSQFCPMCVGALRVGLVHPGLARTEDSESECRSDWFGAIQLPPSGEH